MPTSRRKTWDEFLAACDKLKSAGIAPIGGGIQDGYWGEWYFGHALAQNVDSAGEAVELFTGERDFRDPKYHEHWVRLEELKKQDFLNPDMSSTRALSGHRPDRGRQSWRWASPIGARLPADSKTTNGRIGSMVMPVYGKGKLAGKPIFDSQGLGISTQCQGSEGGRGLPRISAVAGAAEGASGRRPAGCPPTPPSTPRSSRIRRCVDMWKRWGLVREHPVSLQPGARPVLRAGAAADRAAGRRRARSPASRPASWPPRSPRNGATSIRTWSRTTRSGRPTLGRLIAQDRGAQARHAAPGLAAPF